MGTSRPGWGVHRGMKRGAWVLSFVLESAGCARPGDQTRRGAAPVPSPVTQPGARVPTAAPSDAGAVAQSQPSGTERVYRGTVGGDLAVVARLSRNDRALKGRYFYVAKGSDLDLEGTVDDAGRVELDERGAAHKTTGHFAGTFGTDGALSGTWSDPTGARVLAFRLVPTAPDSATALPIDKKRVHRGADADRMNPVGMRACALYAEYPEINGGIDPAIEAKVNATLRKDAGLDGRCDSPGLTEITYKVVLNRPGLLSIVFERSWCCGAYPSMSKVFTNFTIPAGDRLMLDDLLVKGARPRLARLLRPAVAKIQDPDEPRPALSSDQVTEVLDQLTKDPAEISVEPTGLRFSAFNSQPHVMQGLFDEGIPLPYAKLLPLLRRPSPLDPLLPTAL